MTTKTMSHIVTLVLPPDSHKARLVAHTADAHGCSLADNRSLTSKENVR